MEDGIGMEKVAPNLRKLVWQDASKKTAFHEKYPTLHHSFSTVGVGRRSKLSEQIQFLCSGNGFLSPDLIHFETEIFLFVSPFTRNMAHISDDRQTRIPLTNNALRN